MSACPMTDQDGRVSVLSPQSLDAVQQKSLPTVGGVQITNLLPSYEAVGRGLR